MTSYFRIQYKSVNHGYWEDLSPSKEQAQTFYDLAEKCKKEGAIPAKDQSVSWLLKGLQEHEYFPRAFLKDPVCTVYIELRTVSSVF